MTRKWLTADEDYQELYGRTSKLFQQCVKMKSPHVQVCVCFSCLLLKGHHVIMTHMDLMDVTGMYCIVLMSRKGVFACRGSVK